LARTRCPPLRGTERFFRPGYAAHLVGAWLPALDGVETKLKRGARVADVGCGHGASTIVMAKAFPNARFFGFDYHAPSIERAKQAAAEAGVTDRTEFAVAAAKTFPGTGYDLVTFFDCLHDMGDPVGAARHVREALAKDGSWMIVSHSRTIASGQPQPGRPHLLRRLDDDLHTGLAEPGSRLGLAQSRRGRLREVATPAADAFRRATGPVHPSLRAWL
jgi:SAM-dependent methyltransferase